MTRPALAVDELGARLYTIPTEQREADGTLEWDSLTVLLVTASADGRTGVGYTYTQAGACEVVRGRLAGVVEGCDALDVGAAWAAMWHAVRNDGQTGLVAMAISAVDIALWDLKARPLELPVTVTLDAIHDGTPIYGSGGFCNQKRDDHRLCVARDAIGPG